MYYVSKKMEIAGSHKLNLNYLSPCSNLHGHNWIITVHCKSKQLDENGMVVDFAKVKKLVHGVLDHHNLNEILNFNPTAENIAAWIAGIVTDLCTPSGGICFRVDVQESEGNIAIYEEDKPE
jgi:6-pyruvoyltetrahydropterin/6-carboxytetrahydropterin synthase